MIVNPLRLTSASLCKICGQEAKEKPEYSKFFDCKTSVCNECKNTYDEKTVNFYGYLLDQKTLDSENLEFTENLVLQISSNFYLCQSKCRDYLLREVLVNAKTKKYIICESEKCCFNCERIKSMILLQKVPAITDLMRESNLKRFYLKWVSVFVRFLKKLTEGSILQSKLKILSCYKNTGDKKMMMQPCKRNNCGFGKTVDVAASMKQEICLFVTKYRLDRSVMVFSKALEPQNLEFFTNFDRRKNNTLVDCKTVASNAYVLSGEFKNPTLDLKRKYELQEEKRRCFFQFILVEIFNALIGEKQKYSDDNFQKVLQSLLTTFSDVGPWIRAMSSLTDSGEYICKEGLFRVQQARILKKLVQKRGYE